jgi:hypothetical protein
MIDCRTERNAPGLPNAMPPPLGGPDGGDAAGSGNVVSPRARMHSASLTSSCLRASDPCPLPGPPPGSKFWHALWADWNAGDCGLIPEPAVIWIPPPEPLGSGKFGTPCERSAVGELDPGRHDGAGSAARLARGAAGGEGEGGGGDDGESKDAHVQTAFTGPRVTPA